MPLAPHQDTLGRFARYSKSQEATSLKMLQGECLESIENYQTLPVLRFAQCQRNISSISVMCARRQQRSSTRTGDVQAEGQGQGVCGWYGDWGWRWRGKPEGTVAYAWLWPNPLYVQLTLRLQDAPTTPKTPKRGRNPRRTPGTIELPPSKDSVTLTVALTHVAKDPEVLKLTTIEKIEYAQNIMLTLFSWDSFARLTTTMKAIRERKIQEEVFAMKLQKKDDSISQLLCDIERKYRVIENLRSTQDLAVANTYIANCQFWRSGSKQTIWWKT